MQSRNPFLDDMARLASGAAGVFSGLRAEVDAMVRQQMQRILDDMHLVRRDEFDAVAAMAARAREEQERLGARLAELEAKLAEAPEAAPRARRKAAED